MESFPCCPRPRTVSAARRSSATGTRRLCRRRRHRERSAWPSAGIEEPKRGLKKRPPGCFPGHKNCARPSDSFTQNPGSANCNFIVHNYNCQVTGMMLVSLEAVVTCKNESEKINRSKLGAWLGSRRGAGTDPVVFRSGRAGFGRLGEGWRRLAGAVHYMGRRHGDLLRQRRTQDQVGHYFSETGAQSEPDAGR